MSLAFTPNLPGATLTAAADALVAAASEHGLAVVIAGPLTYSYAAPSGGFDLLAQDVTAPFTYPAVPGIFSEPSAGTAGTLLVRSGADVLGTISGTIDVVGFFDALEAEISATDPLALDVFLGLPAPFPTEGPDTRAEADADPLAETIDLLGGNDDFALGGGDDTAWGGAGDDTLYGGPGNDELRGEGGRDTLFGGADDDLLFGGDSLDKVFGDGGNDTLHGEANRDLLEGGDGNDLLFGGDDRDTLYGGSGDDTLEGGDGIDRLEGGLGNDILFGNSNDDDLRGKEGDDTLYGGVSRDELRGGPGSDWLYGGRSDDLIYGGGAGSGVDRLFGEHGNDMLIGGNQRDSIDGGEGNDTLRGSLGSDDLAGGAGADRLEGGRGRDVLTGGEGADVFVFGTRAGTDRIKDFDVAEDRIELQGASLLGLEERELGTHVFHSGGTIVVEGYFFTASEGAEAALLAVIDIA